MSLPGSIKDREWRKFIESPTRPNQTAIEVITNSAFSIPSNATCYTFEQSTSGQYYLDVFKFYESGTPIAPVNLLKTITIYYSDRQRIYDIGGTFE